MLPAFAKVGLAIQWVEVSEASEQQNQPEETIHCDAINPSLAGCCQQRFWFKRLLSRLADVLSDRSRGRGQALHVQEPTTGGWYWLYLPEDHILACKQHASARKGGAFVTGRSWPLVVTFHGMKPFDNAASQIREWQQEADRYGFVVIAPQLASPDLLAEFPLQHVHPGVKRDETLTMRAIDDVVRRADVDPNQVLSTSWSSGGYLAHYMANRHPERFSCIAPRQSNFSASVLDPSKVDLYRSNKVGIFYTENDLAICRRESQAAASWYSKHGFDVTFAVFKDLGHQRRPRGRQRLSLPRLVEQRQKARLRNSP